MNEDPSAIHVLYLDVVDINEKESSGSAGLNQLQQITKIAVEALKAEDLLSPSDDR